MQRADDAAVRVAQSEPVIARPEPCGPFDPLARSILAAAAQEAGNPLLGQGQLGARTDLDGQLLIVFAEDPPFENAPIAQLDLVFGGQAFARSPLGSLARLERS
jgi:hypothetical protein